jgi:Spy/CpxP family protein refolding chaperone
MTIIRNFLLPAIAAVSLAISAAMPMQAQQGGDPLALYKQAGASEKQLAEIAAVQKSFEGTAHSCNERGSEVQKKLHDLSLQPVPDEKAALAAQKEMNDVIADIGAAHMKMMIKARKILTPEQRLKVVELLKQREAAGQHPGQP